MELGEGCLSVAMGVLPHHDVERALRLALTLDVPFWPQLPNVSFAEDMYVQAARGFPGLQVDEANSRLRFSTERFVAELDDYSQLGENDDSFALDATESVVYHRFLQEDLRSYPAIRGQVIGPVSFGFRVVDEERRPIIYDDGVRALLFEFLRRKVNRQYRELRQANGNAFVWVDEPGLGWVFSALSGYSDRALQDEYRLFLDGLEGPRALHLCAPVNLPYLLNLGFEVVSFDIHQADTMPAEYARCAGEFIHNGGVIAWGMVPTDGEALAAEALADLSARLETIWRKTAAHGALSVEEVAARSMIAPARCCLKNVSGEEPPVLAGARDAVECSPEERIVEAAFARLRELAQTLRRKYGV